MVPVKVVVFGKGEAGKSTLIQQLIPDAVNIESSGRTIAMDYGFVNFGRWTFHFWGTPGQAHLAVVREALVPGIDVAIMVLDSSRYFDSEDRAILDEIHKKGVPYLLFLNQKPTGQREGRTVERLLEGFPMPYKIIEGSAKSKSTASELLSVLRDTAERFFKERKSAEI